MEIKKIANCNYVMFPRLQRTGLKPKRVERDTFKAELKHVEGHGDYWLLYQQSKPHLVVHVQLPKSEADFDNILAQMKTLPFYDYLISIWSLIVLFEIKLHKNNKNRG